MKVLWFCTILVFVAATETFSSSNGNSNDITTANTQTTTTTTTENHDARCNCDDRCPESKVIGLPGNDTKDDEVTRQLLLDEDADKDGERTICARNRDMIDRTFSSLCHMMCVNTCTRYRMRKMIYENNVIPIAAVFRENFYKLHDGSC